MTQVGTFSPWTVNASLTPAATPGAVFWSLPQPQALSVSFGLALPATPRPPASASFLLPLLTAMAEKPLSPAIFILESIQGRGEPFRRLGMPSLYARVETLLKRGIAAGEFRKMDPWHGAINIIGSLRFLLLCGRQYLQDR